MKDDKTATAQIVQAAKMPPEFEDLVQWLEQQMSAGCTRLVLRQMNHDTGSEQLVTDFPVQEVRDYSMLARTLLGRAREDGRFSRGNVVYIVYAYCEHQQLDRKYLDTGEPGVLGRTEGPTVAGLTSQMMRHYEANMRGSTGSFLEIIAHLRAVLAQREKRISELEEKHAKVLDLYERMTSMEHERQLATRRAALEERRFEYFGEKVNLLAPVVLSRLAGGAGGGAPIFKEEAVRQLAGSIDPSQFDALMRVLRPEQAAVLYEIYLAYGKRDVEQKAAAAEKAASANGADTTNGKAAH